MPNFDFMIIKIVLIVRNNYANYCSHWKNIVLGSGGL